MESTVGSTAGQDTHVNELRQSALVRPVLEADDLDNHVKETANSKCCCVVGPRIRLSNSFIQRLGRTACPLGVPPACYLLQPGLVTKCWAFRVTFLEMQHDELRLWTLPSNSGSDPGSVIHWLHSMGKLLHLEPPFPHL